MNKFRLIVLLAGLFLVPGNLLALGIGETGAPFLKIGVGARAASMGEAYTAAADDVTSLYWNPAGLSFLQDRQAIFMHDIWGEQVYLDYLAYAQTIGNDDALGASATYFWMSPVDVNDDSGKLTGQTWSVYDICGTLGYSRKLGDKFSLGITAKYIQDQLGTFQSIGFAGDFGLLCKIISDPDVRIGAVIQNIGTPIQFISASSVLPLVGKVGAYSLIYRDADNAVGIAADMVVPNDNYIYGDYGLEYSLQNVLIFRGGYMSRPDAPSLSLGVGIKQATEDFMAELDYSFTSQNATSQGMGAIHRISLLYGF